MDWKSRKTPLMGFIGGLGVVAFLVGVPGGFYSLTTAIVLAFAIWIVGGHADQRADSLTLARAARGL